MDNIYVLSSVFALSMKLAMLLLGRKSLVKTPPLLIIFVAAFFVANLIEFAGFAFFNQNIDLAFYPLVSYYFALVTVAFSMLGLSIQSVGKLSRNVTIALAVTWGLIGIALFTRGIVLSGVQSIGYSLSKIEGPYYVVGPLSCLIPLIISLGVLIYGLFIKRGQDRSFCIVLIYALVPVLATQVSVAALMASGVKINATIVLSFASILSVGILIYYQKIIYAFRVVAVCRVTGESDFLNIVNDVYTQKTTLNDASILFQAAIIGQTLKKTNGDAQEAHKLLGAGGSESSQRRCFKKVKAIEDKVLEDKERSLIGLTPRYMSTVIDTP